MAERSDVIRELKRMEGWFDFISDLYGIGSNARNVLVEWGKTLNGAIGMLEAMPTEKSEPARRKCAKCAHCYDTIETLEHYSGGGDGSFYCGKLEIDFLAPEYDAERWSCADWKEREGNKGVKIIKEGDLERVKSARRFECVHCGCVFEATGSEYRVETDFRNGHYYVMACPTCHRDVVAHPEDREQA